jgi:hypothetical protein
VLGTIRRRFAKKNTKRFVRFLSTQNRLAAAALALLLVFAPLRAEEVYLAPDAFLAQVFGGGAPKASTLWLTAPLAADATRILGHPPRQLRQRYWMSGDRSAWILEEIGKEEFITAGFVVQAGRMDHARVLVYRESRGGEVRYPAFLKQFVGVTLGVEQQLSARIDNIAGATLSVSSMSRMARLALYFDAAARQTSKPADAANASQ